MRAKGQGSKSRHGRPPRAKAAKFATTVVVGVVGTVIARRRGYSGMGGNTVVRCRQGHVFTTIWVPGASLKALRLGWWRYQRCPVDRHWSLVSPVKESTLSDEELRAAKELRDIRLP